MGSAMLGGAMRIHGAPRPIPRWLSYTHSILLPPRRDVRQWVTRMESPCVSLWQFAYLLATMKNSVSPSTADARQSGYTTTPTSRQAFCCFSLSLLPPYNVTIATLATPQSSVHLG